MFMDKRTFRKRVLQDFGGSAPEVNELLRYNTNHFDQTPFQSGLSLPLDDEAFVPVWEKYAEEASDIGVFEALKKRLIQFQFPIAEGMSTKNAYQLAVRKGITPENHTKNTGLILNAPEQLQLLVHQTPAGKIPVVIASGREDFVILLRALAMRNEPKRVPMSQGAAILVGYNNWDRIRTLRMRFEHQSREENPESAWRIYFKTIVPKKHLYQDNIILLSNDYYSGVSPAQLGLGESEWRKISVAIRLEHESTHYVTKRIYGSMQNNLLDELIADCIAIVTAIGYFDANWFLAFMGLENYPAYREGGRLQNYRGTPPLSDGAFKILQQLIYHAALNLETATRRYATTHTQSLSTYRLVTTLTGLTLEELAHKGLGEKMHRHGSVPY
jgi:hypothetical protein